MIENKIIEKYPSLSGACVELKSCCCLVDEDKIHFAKLLRFNPPFNCEKKGRNFPAQRDQ
jgi:hypothetical protein